MHDFKSSALLICFLLIGAFLSAQTFQQLWLKKDEIKENKIKTIEVKLETEDELFAQFNGENIYVANYRPDGQYTHRMQYILDEDRTVIKETSYEYNQEDLLIKTEVKEYPAGRKEDFTRSHWEYEYDENGILTTTNSYMSGTLSSTTKHYFNEQGLPSKNIRESHLGSKTYSSYEEVFTYDEENRPVERIITRRNGNIDRSKYDKDGRIVEMEFGKTGKRLTFVTDQITGQMVMNTYKDGELQSTQAVLGDEPERTERKDGLPSKIFWNADIAMVWAVGYEKY